LTGSFEVVEQWIASLVKRYSQDFPNPSQRIQLLLPAGFYDSEDALSE
tara:strand:- start:783 stop:926 length:144 start_codon:yes stop_codon:yes gene_type:complete